MMAAVCIGMALLGVLLLVLVLHGAVIAWSESEAERQAGAIEPARENGTTTGTTTTSQRRPGGRSGAVSESETMSAEGWAGCRMHLDDQWARSLQHREGERE